jgi:hypothetical protein
MARPALMAETEILMANIVAQERPLMAEIIRLQI